MSRLDDTITILRDLVAFPTVSADSNLAMIDYLAERLSDAGARVELFKDDSGQKANLFATLGPKGQHSDGPKGQHSDDPEGQHADGPEGVQDGGIVLSGHTDVVPVTDQIWSHDPFKLHEEGGALYGRGTCDMKGFIAATLAMAPDLARHATHRPLHFAFTYDEEVGCLGAQALTRALTARGIRPAAALIGEPTSMRIIEGHKGCCEYTTRFQGRAGHGSTPDLGVNAVEYAVRYVARLMELRDALKPRAPAGSRFNPPWTTINTGSLQGGIAHNVIPDHAEIAWEMRPVQASDSAFVKSAMQAYVRNDLLPAMQAVWPDAAITTQVIGEVDGLEPADQNEARDIIAELTGANGADVVAFGTEAGLFQTLGMDVVVCGPGSIEQAHKPDEFITIDQLGQCVALLERLGPKLRQPAPVKG